MTSQSKERPATSTEILTIYSDAGVSIMAAALLAEGVTAAEARHRAAGAAEIRAAVTMAGAMNPSIKPSLADRYIAEAKTPDAAKSALFELVTLSVDFAVNLKADMRRRAGMSADQVTQTDSYMVADIKRRAGIRE